MSQWRQNYLGTDLPASGHKPGAIEDRVGFYNALFQGLAPIVFLLIWLAVLGFGFSAARDRRLDARERAVGRLAVVLGVAAFFEFLAVMLGEGHSDVYKHMVLANEFFALSVPALLVAVWSRARMFLRDLAEVA
jgi:hypothetical protein